MRHVNYTLKPAMIDNAKPREKTYPLTDDGGLQLEVVPSRSKTWRFKYHLNGKREKVTISAYPAFTIKQARDRHEELRALVERGQSPAKAKRVLSTEQKLAGARRLSLRSFAQPQQGVAHAGANGLGGAATCAGLAPAHPRDGRAALAAGDGQGHGRRAWHGCHRGAPALHRKGRATADRRLSRCSTRRQGGIARDRRSMAVRRYAHPGGQ